MCPICHDTYWKSIEVDGIERVACCECWREALVDRALVDAGIPPGYRHCSLNNFEHRGTNSLMEALRAAAASPSDSRSSTRACSSSVRPASARPIWPWLH